MKHYLRQHALPLDYVHIDPIGGGVANNIALLTTGRIDAVVAGAALGFNLELEKRARLLIPHFDLGMAFVGEALYASGPMIRDHPDAVSRFVKAWFENIAWIALHRAETIEIARSYTNFAASVEAREYDQDVPMFSRSGEFSDAALTNLGQSFVDMGLLPQPPDMAKLITTRFLPTR
jgi:ABC-type nitrate/sulfonate/bicarbonate transport system substrate-binding protein